MSRSVAEMQRRHEEFKSRLVNDVFGRDNKGKVPMEKVMMLIWQFRDDSSVVQFMAQFVAKYAGSRDVFDGIEFYLPQLAHMIIHLEANWDDAILERFALIIAQVSLHFALQFNWILQGQIEDYQPETPDGEPNPQYNPLFYSRCVKLLSNIERCVVYGTPRTHELQRLYEKGKISKKEYELLEQADRRFNAAQITGAVTSNVGAVLDTSAGLAAGCGIPGDDNNSKMFGGFLLYKRHIRTSVCKPKPWKTRYFAISERMLYCYNKRPSEGGELVRAMPLEGASVEKLVEGSSPKNKYPHMFEVSNQHWNFRMRANDEDDRNRWIAVLKEETEANALYPHNVAASALGATTGGDDYNSGNDREVDVESGKPDELGDHSEKQFMKDLTPSQRARYDFFKNERDFVWRMCDVAEDLRFKDRLERKLLAPSLMATLEIPPCVYIPMCNSTDIWRRVHSTRPIDTRVFNTKERCPVIMYFVTKRGEKMHHHRGGLKDVNLDVVEYMHLQYEVPDPPSARLKPDKMTAIDEAESEQLEAEKNEISTPGEINVANHSSGHGFDKNDNINLDCDDDANDDEYAGNNRLVWYEESKQMSSRAGESQEVPSSPVAKGNRQVQRLIRENFVSVPKMLAARMREKGMSRRSMLDQAILPMESVPIVNTQNADDADDSSVVSDATGSIMLPDGLLLYEEERDGIERACLDRAKIIVCGGETWTEKSERMLREFSTEDQPHDEHDATTEIFGVMAKSNDDLRQEVFVMQMIHFYKSVFAKALLPIWLKTYRILSTSKSTGLIEVLKDATSIDSLKKSLSFPAEGGLRAYFENVYGPSASASFKAAQRNFMLSLVGYSLVSYLLGLKDRHNGNIMIDMRGRLIFIDFGFAMGMAPGHEFSMERAAFKLTGDYMNVMDGRNSDCFAEFKRLFVAGFQAARANSQIALGLVEIMMYKSNYPCFTGHRYGHGVSLKKFEDRLMLNVPEKSVSKAAVRLVENAIDHPGTKLYDKFQLMTNGYAM